MRHLKNILPAALALGLFLAANSYGIVIHNGGNQADYIAYGNQFTSTVAALYLDVNGSGWGRGSSVVIDDGHWVLTAAHNYFDSNRNPLYSGAVIVTGSSLSSDLGTPYYADQWFCHPDHTGGAYGADIALLYFKDPILGVDYAERYRGTLSEGQSVSIIGFGRTGTPNSGYLEADDWARRGCQNNIKYLGGMVSFPDYAMFSDFFPSGHAAYNPLGGIAAPGDSGGGWYSADSLLIGITSAKNGAGYYHSTIGMDITYFNNWIDAAMASVNRTRSFNLRDFVQLAKCWQSVSGQLPFNGAWDLVEDDVIDLNDLAFFADRWLYEEPRPATLSAPMDAASKTDKRVFDPNTIRFEPFIDEGFLIHLQ